MKRSVTSRVPPPGPAGVGRVLIVGSQAVLGTHHDEELPAEVLVSIEADIVVLDDVDDHAHHVSRRAS